MGKFGWIGVGKKLPTENKSTSTIKRNIVNSLDELEAWEHVGDRRNDNQVVDLLSRPGGDIDIDEDHRLFVAVIKDELHCKDPNDVVLLVSGDPQAKRVMQLTEQLIRQENYKLVKRYLASPSFIGSQYEGYANYQFKSEELLSDDDKWIEDKINEIISRAVLEKASDIHFTLRAQLVTRFRVDGDMETVISNMPHKRGESFVRSFYKLHISPNHPNDFQEYERVSASTSIPIDFGDGTSRTVRLRYEQAPGAPLGDNRLSIDITLRIISDGSKLNIPNFSMLGFDIHSNLLLNRISRKDRGILLIVGGTGSGKSTTLDSFYQACKENSGDTKKIVAIADPPENHVPGVNIQPLHPDGASRDEQKDESNKATIKALKSALRQDPDVLGVGEIRDPDIAKLTFEASLTGHLVGSTLHSSRSFDAYTRVINYYGFNSSMMCSPGMVQAIIAQQLEKKLCSECALTYEDIKKEPLYNDIISVEKYFEKNIPAVSNRDHVKDVEIQRMKNLEIPESLWYRDYSTYRFRNTRNDNKCSACDGKGKDGRILLYEIFVPSRHPKVVELIAKGDIGAALTKWRNTKNTNYSENMIDGITLDERAMMYAKEGITCTYKTLSILGGL